MPLPNIVLAHLTRIHNDEAVERYTDREVIARQQDEIHALRAQLEAERETVRFLSAYIAEHIGKEE